MQYQKITNLIDDTPNQPSKFTTKNWFEINHDARIAKMVNLDLKLQC